MKKDEKIRMFVRAYRDFVNNFKPYGVDSVEKRINFEYMADELEHLAILARTIDVE